MAPTPTIFETEVVGALGICGSEWHLLFLLRMSLVFKVFQGPKHPLKGCFSSFETKHKHSQILNKHVLVFFLDASNFFKRRVQKMTSRFGEVPLLQETQIWPFACSFVPGDLSLEAPDFEEGLCSRMWTMEEERLWKRRMCCVFFVGRRHEGGPKSTDAPAVRWKVLRGWEGLTVDPVPGGRNSSG